MSLKQELSDSGKWLFRWRSYFPLLFAPVLILALKDFRFLGENQFLDGLWEVACLAVASMGLLLRILTVGYVPAHTSGRNTRNQKAESLNTTGIYSAVRHPLYFANFLIWVSICMFAHVWWVLLIGVLAYWIYYERIMLAEEEFLNNKFGRDFEEWAAKTPAFIPAFHKWSKPSLPFSWKSVIRREHPTWLGTIFALFLLEVIGDLFVEHALHFELPWLILLLAAVLVYAVARWMSKHRVLTVEGR